MTTSATTIDFDGLPGADLVERGLRDCAAGKWTVEALLLCVATRRLRALGLDVPTHRTADPELALYRAIGESGCDDPYYRYNALMRELDSFVEAASARRRRAAAAG